MSTELYAKLAGEVTHVIHAEWKMDFNSLVNAFEKSCIRPTYDLLQFCRLSKLKHFHFISSVSSAMNYPDNTVPERIIDSQRYAAAIG